MLKLTGEEKKIMEKLINDPEFQAAFEKDPYNALVSEGIALSPERVEEIKAQTSDGRLQALLSKSGPGMDGKSFGF